jgi:hypothetical protein
MCGVVVRLCGVPTILSQFGHSFMLPRPVHDFFFYEGMMYNLGIWLL